MNLSFNRPELASSVESAMAGGPGEDVDSWAHALLDQAVQLPGEMAPLRRAAAERVQQQDSAEVYQVWADLVGRLSDSKSSVTSLAEGVAALAEAGAPVQATRGLARVARLARVRDHRPVAEAMCLAMHGVCDAASGASGLVCGHQEVGEEPQAQVLADGFALLGAGEHRGLADLLQHRASELADGRDEFIATLVAAAAALRATQVIAVDSAWHQGQAARGLGFAIAPVGDARFEGYFDYLTRRGVHSVWVAAFAQRWALALSARGRLSRAHALLDSAIRALPEDPEASWARLATLRCQASVWRQAGDLDRALRCNDAGMAIVESAHSSASQRAGAYLNREFILREMGDSTEAFRFATKALDDYRSMHGIAQLGVLEALAAVILGDPDRNRALAQARRLATSHRDDPESLPRPVRAMVLRHAGLVIGESDLDEALPVLDAAATAARRRVAVLAPLDAVALLLDAGRAEEAQQWARRAVGEASRQENPLLKARAHLALVRCLAGREDAQAAEVGRAGLLALSQSLLGLTAAGEEDVVKSVRDGLTDLFDVAVRQGDGELALQVAETGRTIRLSAMMRMNPDQLPDPVREAIAEATGAQRAATEGQQSDEDTPPGPRTRAAAKYVPQTMQTLDRTLGEILANVTTNALFDPDGLRTEFTDAHLLSLSLKAGTLRWVWWAPNATLPTAGLVDLPPRLTALIGAYATGAAALKPGDPTRDLHRLLPEGLSATLMADTAIQQVLISPTGSLWSVPYPAIALGDGRRLIDVATVTLAPSFRMGREIAMREASRGPGVGLDAYVNPHLPGAALEWTALQQGWPTAKPLAGVTEFGHDNGLDMSVMATHADNQPGLAQSLHDHTNRTLSAGQCLLRHFARTVILATCHGYTDPRAGNGQDADGPDPIGLMTVIMSRGATWVVGGHQQLRDAAVGWILARTYHNLATGHQITQALRTAQLEYLRNLDTPDDPDFTQLIQSLGGPTAAKQPWCWALTIVGPPQDQSRGRFQ